MTYELLTADHDLKAGDRISLKVEANGEQRDGFITEFEDAGFWIRFDDETTAITCSLLSSRARLTWQRRIQSSLHTNG